MALNATFQSIRGRRFGLALRDGLVTSFGSAGKELLTGLSQDFTITSAQLLALNATPQTIVAAPGAGRVLIPAALYLFYDYVAAAYGGIATGEDLAVRYTNASGAVALTVETTGFLDQTSDQYRWAEQGSAAATAGGFAPVANAALVLHMTTGEITTGDGPLYGRLYYYNIPATLPTPAIF